MIALIPMLLYFIKVLIIYTQSIEYRNDTKTPLSKLISDNGVYGEYLTYNIIKKFDGKVLSNVYVPKKNNTTTEIDLLLINKKGIFVLESKNYSGKIYGSQDSKYRMQILKNNKRNRFYSPILQNQSHIKHLSNLLDEVDNKYIYSVIVFSKRCSIRKMEVNNDIKVVNRDRLYKTIKNINKSREDVFSEKDIHHIYYKLVKYTNVSESIKDKHIENIKNKYYTN